MIFFLVLTLGLTCGCHSIRKKFTRKRRKKEAPVYVSFKEYPEKSSRGVYINYYLFVRGWLDDLTEALNKGISYKRQRRAINEAIMNLEQMIAFYDGEGKDAIYPIYEEFQGFRDEITKSPNMSKGKRNSLIRRIERVKRKFEKNFNYSDAEKWMG